MCAHVTASRSRMKTSMLETAHLAYGGRSSLACTCSISIRGCAKPRVANCAHVSHVLLCRTHRRVPVVTAARALKYAPDTPLQWCAMTVLPIICSLLVCFDCQAVTPYEEARRIVYGPLADGTIRSCPSSINPNCISTGSTNVGYSPAWRAPESSVKTAADALEQTIAAVLPQSELVRVQHLSSGEYRAFTVDR